MKDPNKALLRLYDIPDNTFDSEGSEQSSDDGKKNNFFLLEKGKFLFYLK